MSSAVVNEPKPPFSSKRLAVIPFKKTSASQFFDDGKHENKYFVLGLTAILIDCGAAEFHPLVYERASLPVKVIDFSL